MLAPDGTVLAATGGAPASWIGSSIDTIEALRGTARVAERSPGRRDPSTSFAISANETSANIPALELIWVQALPLRRVRTDLVRLLDSGLAALKEQAHAMTVELRVEASDTLPRELWLDPEKVAWSVATLVGNALRYVRQGTRLRPGGSIHVKIDFSTPRRELSIAVEDDGSGIPADKLPRLFERQSATHAAGLSLTLIQDVVTALGGRIDVESSTDRVEHGTNVTLRIPVP